MKYVTPKKLYLSEAHISNNSCGKKKEHDDGCKFVQGNEILLPVSTNLNFTFCVTDYKLKVRVTWKK